MSDRFFFDSNVLVYAYDSSAPAKQRRAQSLLADGLQSDCATLSTQVLSEFFVTVTAKIREPMSALEAQDVLNTLCIIPVVEIDLPMINRAIDTHRSYGISYWDALIVSAAERAGCLTILSEDLNDGQAYHGITVRDPFREIRD